MGLAHTVETTRIKDLEAVGTPLDIRTIQEANFPVSPLGTCRSVCAIGKA